MLLSAGGQIFSQALLLISHVYALTSDSVRRSGEPRPDWGGSVEVTFGLAAGYGLVAVFVALGAGVADGAIRRAATGRTQGDGNGARGPARPPWWTVFCVLPGLCFGAVLVFAYLLLSWFTGDGCLTLYGGPCPPKAPLPHQLLYALSALPLALAWVVALLVAHTLRKGDG